MKLSLSFSKSGNDASWIARSVACAMWLGACSADDGGSNAGTGGAAGVMPTAGMSAMAGTTGGTSAMAGMTGGSSAMAGTTGGMGMVAGTTGGMNAMAGTTGGMNAMAGVGGGDGGASDGGVVEDPFVPTGEPLAAPAMTWTWLDFPDTKCRDGSMAGIAVSLNPASDKLMIFMQGGGACFDAITCAGNPTNASGQKAELVQGLFARSNDENPVKDWNWVFVPYCTGDVHLGTKDDGMVAGVAGTQHFVGRLNLEKYLHRVVPTFPAISQVLLTGVSAGGFGAAANMEFVQWAFGDVPVTAIDDSGPPMSTTYLPECLQQKWSETWGFADSILKDCGDDCPNPNEFSIPYSLHVARKFPDHMGGLIETTNDSVITLFYGFGTNECTGSFLTPLPQAQFQAGLLEYRATIMAETTGSGGLGTYYVAGSQHTWLAGGSFYSQTVGGVRMVDWFTDIVEGTAAAHVGP